MRKEHPLIVALVEALARECGVDPKVLWDALDGKPSPPRFVRALVEAFAPGLSEADFVIEGLPSSKKNGTIRTMSATEYAAVTPRKGRPMELKHPLMKALKKARVTVVEEGKSVGRSPPSIRSFCYPKGDPSARPVPRALVDHWAKKYGTKDSDWAEIGD